MSKVNFYFITLDDDGDEVKELIGWDEGCDKNKGWQWIDFDNLVVEFCEKACDKLQTGDVIRIVAEFGCSPIPIE